MPIEPKDTKEQPKSSAAVPNSSATNSEPEATENSETVREAFMKKISGNPNFILAKPSGRAFMLPMGKPSAKH